jgi:VWFA-related protein
MRGASFHRVRLACILAAVALPAAFSARVAQQPSGPDGATRVPPVRIDAVVTDAQGRPVLDLRPADFELLENGAAKPLASVELRTLPRASVEEAGSIATDADESRAAVRPGTRVFAFLLDEFHVSPGASADRVRDALTRFIDDKLRPQDLAVVMKPLDSVSSIRLTRDRTLLRGVVAGFTGRKGDYAPRTRFEEQYIGRAPGAVKAARIQIVTAALRELTLRLGELEADRGVLVLFSEGFPRDNVGSRSRIPDLQGVVRAASRFHLATYTFNPAAAAEDAAPVDRERATATLEWLAAQTGGTSVAAHEFTAGLARVAQDTETYYTLTYQPTQADGRFHPIEVRAKRRNVQVRTRPGYWAPLDSDMRALLSANSRLPAISRRGLKRSTIIEAWVGLVGEANGRARMVISWEPRTARATAQAVLVKARTSEGAPLFDGRIARVGSGAAAADSARFEVPTGRIEIDMTIVDIEGKVLDTDVRDYDVPDLKAGKRGPVLMSPGLVRARTLPDFRAASADPDAAPSSLRTFARGDRLLIRVPAFDPSGTAVEVTAKVLNDRGQPMRSIDATAGAPRDGVTEFALPLAWLVPGAYLLEVTGMNVHGAVKERVAFRVTG